MASKFNRELAYVAVIIILLAALVYISAYSPQFDNPQIAVENARNIYTLLAGNATVQVLSSTDESGVYRIALSVPVNGQNVVQEVFVTKDGKLITDRMINASAYQDALVSQKNFAECLMSKGVVVAGQTGEQNTQAQLQILGSFAYKIFVDCSGNNLQLCQNAGITQVPTTIIGNQSTQGVQQITFYEEATGCKVQ